VKCLEEVRQSRGQFENVKADDNWLVLNLL